MISDCPTDQAYDACQIKINRKGKINYLDRLGLRLLPDQITREGEINFLERLGFRLLLAPFLTESACDF